MPRTLPSLISLAGLIIIIVAGFQYWLAVGRIDVAALSAAGQIDDGNLKWQCTYLLSETCNTVLGQLVELGESSGYQPLFFWLGAALFVAGVVMTVTNKGRREAMGRVTAALEFDTRLLGMVGALILIWIGFDVMTDGNFLTARNLWNLSVQTSVVAIVATGMVLVIVTRNIDLSVGSVLGFLGMVMAVVQVEILPRGLGIPPQMEVGLLGLDFQVHPLFTIEMALGNAYLWIVAVLAGVLVGAVIGLFQGFWIAYAGVPAFIVTLGGLLVFRGAAWWVTSGRTVAPMDPTFQDLGGGIGGSIGATGSWIVGGLAVLLFVVGAIRERARRRQFDFPQKPMWAEITVVILTVVLVLGAVQIMNSFYQPERTVATRIVDDLLQEGTALPDGGVTFTEAGEAIIATLPEEAQALATQIDDRRSERELVGVLADWPGLERIARGIPIPVLILIGVALAMTFIATRTSFGRYIFAIGGNPEAAVLAGVNAKRVVLYIFILMGVLCAIAAAVQTARLNAGANSTGTLLELQAIAAAVIGGTSLAGGIGTIPGALLGALVMQSLQSGMLLLGMDTPLQNIVIGFVLIVAVWIDIVYQKRRK